jgi:hypothetical protein
MVDNTKVDVLAEQLRQRIREGEFGTNGRLPYSSYTEIIPYCPLVTSFPVS